MKLADRNVATVPTNRLFYALLPSPEVRDACNRAGREVSIQNQSNGRPQSPDDFHLTVLFLGDQVSESDEAKAISALKVVTGDPVEFTLNHASSFKESKVWWLGLADVPTALSDLRNDLKTVVSDLGIVSDRRKFVPHVTFQRGATDPLPITRIQPVTWASQELVLIRSRIDSTPRSYEVLAKCQLNGRQVKAAMKQMSLL